MGCYTTETACLSYCVSGCTYYKSRNKFCCGSSASNLSTGAIVGIVIFVVVFIVAIILSIYFAKNSKKFLDNVSKNTSVTVV